MPFVDWTLRITPAVILLVLVFVFLRRRFHMDFPFFFSYIVYAPLATAVRIFLRTRPFAYFVAYWSTEAVFGILALLALNEIFRSLFASDYEDHRWFRLILPVMATVIGGIFLLEPIRPTNLPMANAVFSFDLGVHFLQATVLILFLILEKVLGAAYDQYEQGIIAGFGISASVTIFTDLVRFHGGSAYTVYFTYVPPAAYILVTAVWLRAFVKRPPPRQRLPVKLADLLNLLKREAEIAERIARKWRLWRFQS